MKLQITGQSTSSGGYSTIQDEGVDLTTRTKINFTGAGVTASDSGTVTIVNIPGGAGTTGQSEIDFGFRETTTSLFVSDATIGAAQKIAATIAAKATTNNTVDDHWIENLTVSAGNVQAGVGFTLYAKCLLGWAHGKFNINWSYL